MRLIRLEDVDDRVVFVNPERVVQLWVDALNGCVMVGMPDRMHLQLKTSDLEAVAVLLAQTPGDGLGEETLPREEPAIAMDLPCGEDVAAVDYATLSMVPLLPVPSAGGHVMRWDMVLVAFESLSMEERSGVLAALSRANERANRSEPRCIGCGQPVGQMHLDGCTTREPV